MKSITIVVRNSNHSARIAELLGISALAETVDIPMTAIDGCIVDRLNNLPLESDRDSAVTERVTPQRIDRTVILNQAEQTAKLKNDADFLAVTVQSETIEAKQAAYEKFSTARRQLREAAVLRSISTDIAVQGTVLIYGFEVPGTRLVRPDGIHRVCNTLIHGTHPLSPEEEYLRELQVTCDRVIRYHVPGLDDGPWQNINQPLHWPMTPQEFRSLCTIRYRMSYNQHLDAG